MPSDDDDTEDKVIGIGLFSYSSDDYESDVEIGATLISDASDEDSDSGIEIGTSIRAIERERLDSAGSIELGISFETMVGDEQLQMKQLPKQVQTLEEIGSTRI